MQFKDKFIGFVDILGFKSMVSAAEQGGRPTLVELLEFRADFGKRQQLRISWLSTV